MSRRLDLKVGFSCNNNCIFCAQAHKRHLGDRSTEELKKDLESALENGCTEVVFTGGEPTIRKDIFELVAYAKDLGYKLIQIQTNGRMFYYKKFVEKIIRVGATEFSPAIHGYNSKIHESQTRAPGSFKQTITGIKNLKELGQYVITNSVITKINYKTLPQLARLLIDLKVDQFQFAFVHPCGNAWKNFDIVVPRKTEVAPFIHKALDIAKDAGYKPGQVMVEAFPFCFMQGYESFCSELYIPKEEVRDPEMVIKQFENWRIQIGKKKFPQCKNCKFELICEGPWKEYPERFGSEEFKPVKGEKIKDVRELELLKFRRVDLLEV